ncbi:MAG: hypothetical protein D4R50_02455 [Actinomycetales bacterium]|nr:MAG: hypothetical protein D4R50_02455 [Actinomycetales bacterium]
MTKTKAPSFDETPDPRKIVPYFGNSRRLSEIEYFSIRLAVLTPERDCEPKSIAQARSRITSAEITREHFRLLNLSPIFSSWDYEALRLKGVA